MKKIIVFMLVILFGISLAGCNNEQPTNETTDSRIVTEETWNKLIKDYGFAKDANSNFTVSIYLSQTEDLSKPDTILDKDGALFKSTSIISDTEYIVYLDYKNYDTTHKVSDYQKYDITGTDWYIFDVDFPIEEVFDQLSFNKLLEFKSCKYVDGEYKGTGHDEDGFPFEAVYKFDNNKFIEYREYAEGDLIYLLKIDNYDKVRINLPEAYHLDDMPYEEMGKYIDYVVKTLESYRAIEVDSIGAYEKLISLDAVYLRTLKSDNTPKDSSTIKEEIIKLFLEHYFHHCSIKEETSPNNMSVFSIEGTTRKIVFVFDDTEPEYFKFSILDEKVLDVYYFISHFESKCSGSFFNYDDSYYLPSKEAFVIKYDFRESGDYDDIINTTSSIVEEYNGLEWVSSESSEYDHFEVFVNDDMAVKVSFINGGRENLYVISLYVCVSFTDVSAEHIIDYGLDNPLFE